MHLQSPMIPERIFHRIQDAAVTPESHQVSFCLPIFDSIDYWNKSFDFPPVLPMKEENILQTASCTNAI